MIKEHGGVWTDRLKANDSQNEYFIYLPFFEEKFKMDEQNRDRYKSFSDYFSELVTAFAQIDMTNLGY